MFPEPEPFAKTPSAGAPNCVVLPTVLIPAVASSTYFLFATSKSAVGVALTVTWLANNIVNCCDAEPKLNVFVVVGIILSLTVAPKDITSPPSPRLILSPLSVIEPLTVNVFAIETSVNVPSVVVMEFADKTFDVKF